MKITKYLVLAILALLLSSCHDDIETNHQDPPYSDTTLSLWQKYLGKHFTRETSDQFYWTEHSFVYLSSYHNFVESCPKEDRITYLKEGEYVEFFDLTDTQITMRYGTNKASYYYLSTLSDGKITDRVLYPYSNLYLRQEVEIPLIFDFDPNYPHTFFKGSYTDQYGFIYKCCGMILSTLHICYDGVYYKTPFPKLRKETYYSDELYTPEYFLKDLGPLSYSFDKSTLKSNLSPISARWNSALWKGEYASLMPNLADFLQLLLGIPVLNAEEYYTDGGDQTKISIENVMRTAFPGLTQKKVIQYDHKGSPYGYETQDDDFGPLNKALGISKIQDDRICILINCRKISSLEVLKPKNRLFYATVLRSVLSEDRCHFEMHYEMIDCDFNDQSKEREFRLTFEDPQLSRNILEYVILPLVVENRQAIKDYIRQDAELSAHAETLCSAVDHIEEIFAATTDLTLGYTLIEHQWHK